MSSSPRLFCSKSHAAQYNNTKRDQDTRDKQRQSLRQTLSKRPTRPKTAKPSRISQAVKQKTARVRIARPKKIKPAIVGPYTRVYGLKCAHSGHLFYSRTKRKYAPEYQHLYSRDGKALYKFTFNIFDYPGLFDLSLVSQHGWYSVGGKCRKPINKTGCSRDHKVSITDAIANNYDPYYIKHPLNCELMLHIDNKIKHSKSSLTYQELVRRVDEYDLNGGVGGIRTLGTS